MPPQTARPALLSLRAAHARPPRQFQYQCRYRYLSSPSLSVSKTRTRHRDCSVQSTGPTSLTSRCIRILPRKYSTDTAVRGVPTSKRPAESEPGEPILTFRPVAERPAKAAPRGVPINMFFRHLKSGSREEGAPASLSALTNSSSPALSTDSVPVSPFQPFSDFQPAEASASSERKDPTRVRSPHVKGSVSFLTPSNSLRPIPTKESFIPPPSTTSTPPEPSTPERDRISKLRLFAQDPEGSTERHAALREYMKAPPTSTETQFKGLTSRFDDLRTKLGNYAVREWKAGWKKESSVELTWGSRVVEGRGQSTSRFMRVTFGGAKARWERKGNAPREGFVRVYTPVWLRDHCQCSSCVHPDTKQRLLDSFSISLDIEPFEITLEDDGVSIKWDNREGHLSFYPWIWLRQHRFVDDETANTPQLDEPKVFLGNSPNQDDVTVGYEEVMRDDKGVAEWTSKIHRFGYCYVGGCPVTPEATEALLRRIAFIRDTHYGAFWDFTSDLTHKDTAYTSLPLSAHTDTTYFTDPAGVQLFHLLSHTDGSGGSSLLVDGFQAASILQEENPLAHSILTAQRIPWHASGNEGLSIQPATSFPVLEYWQRSSIERPKLGRVRWNNDDRATTDHWRTVEQCIQWYQAAGEWAKLLKRRELEIWSQLVPGRPVIFDNWRMLHGRSAFTGKRRMCGGYINRDDWVSRYRMSNFGKEAVLRAV